jgi:hypothetical protein
MPGSFHAARRGRWSHRQGFPPRRGVMRRLVGVCPSSVDPAAREVWRPPVPQTGMWLACGPEWHRSRSAWPRRSPERFTGALISSQIFVGLTTQGGAVGLQGSALEGPPLAWTSRHTADGTRPLRGFALHFPSRQPRARAVPDTGVRAFRTVDLEGERTQLSESHHSRRWCDHSESLTCQIPGQPSKFDWTSASIVDSGTRSPSALASGVALRP